MESELVNRFPSIKRSVAISSFYIPMFKNLEFCNEEMRLNVLADVKAKYLSRVLSLPNLTTRPTVTAAAHHGFSSLSLSLKSSHWNDRHWRKVKRGYK